MLFRVSRQFADLLRSLVPSQYYSQLAYGILVEKFFYKVFQELKKNELIKRINIMI